MICPRTLRFILRKYVQNFKQQSNLNQTDLIYNSGFMSTNNIQGANMGQRGGKTKGNESTQQKVTRQVLADKEKNEEWKQEREKFLNMPIEQKREKFYKCGKNFKTLNDVETWQEYTQKNSDLTSKAGEVNEEFNRKISLWIGDLTTLEVDAIVNAANETLLGGGGVDGAIHRAAGKTLLKECRSLHGCNTGEAKLSGGYRLPAKYVIHTVGPIGENSVLLSSCYKECLDLAVKNHIKTIAFPCISTGIYGYSVKNATPVVMTTVKNWLQENSKMVDRIIFCVFLDKDVQVYKTNLCNTFPVNPSKESADKENKSHTKENKVMADQSYPKAKGKMAPQPQPHNKEKIKMTEQTHTIEKEEMAVQSHAKKKEEMAVQSHTMEGTVRAYQSHTMEGTVMADQSHPKAKGEMAQHNKDKIKMTDQSHTMEKEEMAVQSHAKKKEEITVQSHTMEKEEMAVQSHAKKKEEMAVQSHTKKKGEMAVQSHMEGTVMADQKKTDMKDDCNLSNTTELQVVKTSDSSDAQVNSSPQAPESKRLKTDGKDSKTTKDSVSEDKNEKTKKETKVKNEPEK